MFYNLYSWAIMAFAFHLRIFQPKKPNQLHCTPTFGRQYAGSECSDFKKKKYCCCDGGEANRSFIKMHFKGKGPVEERFTTTNTYKRKPVVFIKVE